MGGDFTVVLGSTGLVGIGLGKGKLSSLLGDAVSFALHDGIIDVKRIVSMLLDGGGVSFP